MWLLLSDNAYYFGEQAVNRIEPIDQNFNLSSYGAQQSQSVKYRTALFNNNVKVGTVKESVEDILKRIGLSDLVDKK